MDQIFPECIVIVLLHALWDGLPPIITFLFSPGLDVFIAQLVIGFIGFFFLWLRWREARRQKVEELSKQPLNITRIGSE